MTVVLESVWTTVGLRQEWIEGKKRDRNKRQMERWTILEHLVM